MSNSELARQLDISDSTVKRCKKILEDDKLIRVVGRAGSTDSVTVSHDVVLAMNVDMGWVNLTEGVGQNELGGWVKMNHKDSNKDSKENKGDLIDGILDFQDGDQFHDYPADVAEKLRIITRHFPYLKVTNKADWIKQVREHLPFNENTLEKMCEYAKENEWMVARPRSLENAYNLMKQNQTEETEWEAM